MERRPAPPVDVLLCRFAPSEPRTLAGGPAGRVDLVFEDRLREPTNLGREIVLGTQPIVLGMGLSAEVGELLFEMARFRSAGSNRRGEVAGVPDEVQHRIPGICR
jgi:hypothetical protein